MPVKVCSTHGLPTHALTRLPFVPRQLHFTQNLSIVRPTAKKLFNAAAIFQQQDELIQLIKK